MTLKTVPPTHRQVAHLKRRMPPWMPPCDPIDQQWKLRIDAQDLANARRMTDWAVKLRVIEKGLS